MVSLGESGYEEAARAIMDSADVIREGIEAIPQLKIMGNPSMSVISFSARDPSSLNVYNVSEAMSKKHWMLNNLQNPASVHICATYLHRDEVAHRFVEDLNECVKDVIENPSNYAGGAAAVYGMKQALPDASLVSGVALEVIDTLFMP